MTPANVNRVLVVEDYPANVMVVTMLLEELGYSYDVVNCGQDAINSITERPNYYDVILMDVQMPDIDGFETTRRIRAWEREQNQSPHHIIGVTAHALAGDRERCLQAGMSDYLVKPIHPEDLKTKLSTVKEAA